MITYSIDLGGTAIKLAAVEDGQVLREAQLAVNPRESTAQRMAAVAVVLREWRVEGICADAAGIAFAGITDPLACRVLSTNGKYEDAGGFDFAAWASGQGLALAMDNDANAALLGEVHFGAARGSADAVILILGTGIGTAAMMGGAMVRGRHFQAGCLGGHFTVGDHGRDCNCGCHDCAEAYASTWALPGRAREHQGFAASALAREPVVDYRALTHWARQGDPVAVGLLNDCMDVWAAVIKNLVHAYDPEVVVLSGGVMRSADLILEPLRQRVHSNVWTPWGTVDIRLAAQPERSVLLGMHHLASNLRG